MEYANTLKHELSLLKERIIAAIEANLKRIGTAHKAFKEDSLEFFDFRTTEENDITGINADGTLIGTEGTVREYIEDDKIPIDEAVYLLEDLEQI